MRSLFLTLILGILMTISFVGIGAMFFQSLILPAFALGATEEGTDEETDGDSDTEDGDEEDDEGDDDHSDHGY